MAELGPDGVAEHEAVARLARELGVDELVAVGCGGYPDARPVADVDAAVALLRAELVPGDAVLVKASRSAGLDRVAARLLDRSELVSS
jgi:UDP-N-acetylmuramoyl-tripeptide--D-alanyl-D-alanine ligase